MRHITGPRDVRFWIAIAVLLAASASFAIIADAVTDKAPILKQDLQVSVWLHTHGNPVFTAFLLAITDVHSPLGMTIMSCLLAFLLWRAGHHYWTLSLALAVPGGLLINTIIKLTVNRTRPVWEDPILTLSRRASQRAHGGRHALLWIHRRIHGLEHEEGVAPRDRGRWAARSWSRWSASRAPSWACITSRMSSRR
jgi:hypothetical protein